MGKRPILRRAAHWAVRCYQISLSGFIGRQCRYLPTCSDYMDEAITCHGVWQGGWMGAARICRCHPWGGSGFDPVPKRLSSRASWQRPWVAADWKGPTGQERASNCADKA